MPQVIELGNNTIGHRRFKLTGMVRRQPISEWAAGIKIGPATRDDRNHASFWNMNDWRGGLGIKHMGDPQEALTRFYDSDSGIDTRWPDQLMLAPLFEELLAVAEGSSNLRPSKLTTLGAISLWGISDHIFRSADDGETWADTATPASTVTDIKVFTPTGGTAYFYLALLDGTMYRSTDGASGNWGSALNTGSATGQIMVVYDGKLVCFRASGDGVIVNYTTDGTTFTQIGPIGSTSGVFTVGVPLDAVVFPDARGEPMIHVMCLAPGEQTCVYIFDFFAGKFIPQINVEGQSPATTFPIGAGRRLAVYQSRLVWPNRTEVYSYTPGDIRHLGPNRRLENGLPPGMGGETGVVCATPMWLFVPYSTFLGGSDNSTLLCFDGLGWHPLYRSPTSTDILAVGVVADDNVMRLLVLERDYAPGTDEYRIVGAVLPAEGQISTRLATMEFQATSDMITPWFNGGFSEIDGTGLVIKFGGRQMTDDETCTVEYQINDADDDDDWTMLGVFKTNRETIFFPGLPNLHSDSVSGGKSFDNIRFKITLDRGSTTTLTPIVEFIVFQFLKRPELRFQYELPIDLIASAGEDYTVADLNDFLEELYATDELIHLKMGRRHTWVTPITMPFIDELGDEEAETEPETSYVTLQVIEPVDGLRWTES